MIKLGYRYTEIQSSAGILAKIYLGRDPKISAAEFPQIINSVLRRKSVEAFLAVTMLFVHSLVVYGAQWESGVQMLRWLQGRGVTLHGQPLALFPAYEIILNVFRTDACVHGGLDIEWLQKVSLPDHVLDLGLSSRLLFYIGRSTELVTSATSTEEYWLLLEDIRRTQQFVMGIEGEEKRTVERIALSYELAAELMVYCRLLG